MSFFSRMKIIFTLSMVVTLLLSTLLFAAGVVLYKWPGMLVDRYFDPAAKKLNLTKLIINSQESIVPTKDDLPDELEIGAWIRNISTAILILSSAMIVFSQFGILASRSHRRIMLALLALMIAIGMSVQYIFFLNLFDLDSNLHYDIRRELTELLHTQYEIGAKTNRTFTFVANSVMLMAECCGVNSPYDFLEQNWTFAYNLDDKYHEVDVMFPPACCKNRFIQKGFVSTLACARTRSTYNINNIGCYHRILEIIADRYGTAIKWVIVTALIWQVFQIIMALTFLFRPPKEEKACITQALVTRVKEEMLAKMNASKLRRTSPSSIKKRARPRAELVLGKTHDPKDTSTLIW